MNKFTRKAMEANNKIKVDTIQLEPTEDLNAAIVGTYKDKQGKTHVVYSYNLLVECFMRSDGRIKSYTMWTATSPTTPQKIFQ